MEDKNLIGSQNDNNFDKILEKISNNQKEIIQKIESESFIFDNDKRKNKIKLLAILYSTYLSTVTFFEKDRITKDDLDLVIYLFNGKANINNFITDMKALENFNSNYKEKENNQIIKNINNIEISNNNEISEKNILRLDKKKRELVKSLENIPKLEENKNISSCIFCIEEYDQNQIVNPKLECNNYIHGKCFSNYIEEELNNNHFPIRCPICQNNKRHEINYKTILDCLLLNDKDNLALKLETISLNHLAENNSEEVTFCPTAGCNYMCFYDKNEYHLNCPLCKKSYCLKCRTEWHLNKTCQEYQSEKSVKENDIKFEEYVKGNNFKQCPNCKRWVEKTYGCNHITCRCGTHFCYSCGKLMDGNHICPNFNNPFRTNNNSLFRQNNNSLFGTNNNSLFGQKNNSLFGTNNNSLFDQNNSNSIFFKNNSNSLFGKNNSNSLFGKNNSNSLFGKNNSNSIFKQNNNNYILGQNNNNNIFGQNNNSPFGQNNSNNLFGTYNNNLFGTNNNSIFGANNNSLFKQNNNNNIFGQNNNSLFGQNKSNNIFGQNNNNIFIQNNNNNIFGQNNNNIIFEHNNNSLFSPINNNNI